MVKAPGQRRTWDRRNSPICRRPVNQVGNGGISNTASSRRSSVKPVMSAFSNAVAYRLSSARSPGSAGWRGPRSVVGPRCGWGPGRPAVGGGGGGAQQLGDLRRPPPEYVAQDQHRALPGRQVLQGGDQGQPYVHP